MAPLKFEDNIREKLEKRVMSPSKGSWQKLGEQLDGIDGQQKTKKYQWMAIAASIVGFLIMTTVFINSKDSKSIDSKLVETNDELIKREQTNHKVPTKIVIEESKHIRDKSPDKKVEIPVTLVTTENNKKALNKENKQKELPQITADKIHIEEDQEVYASVSDTFSNPIKEYKKLQIDAEIIDSKIAGVMARVKALEKNNGSVADQEIDALLRKAQLEITTQEILKSNTVDASALLLDVELELDESFKDRVYEALKTGFNKLKSAVAERDN